MRLINKSNVKEKFVYISYGLVLDGACERSFSHDVARNVLIFSVGNSSLSHTYSQKTGFLVLGEGPTFGINGNFCSPEKKSS